MCKYVVAELVPIDGGATRMVIWGRGNTAHDAQQDALQAYRKEFAGCMEVDELTSYQKLVDGTEDAGNEMVTSELYVP